MLRTFALIVGLAAILASPLQAVAAKRVALVIGNSDYKHATPLKNPKNDAAAISGVLTRLGFEVTTGIDLTDRKFGRTVAQFRKSLSGASVALFFYAGHGIQVHGRNFLVPVDAQLEYEDSLDFEAVQLKTILRLMEGEPRTNLVFLDACRDNPLARNLARNLGTRSASVGRGFAREESGIGTMIAFATQPGNVALDGDERHSPFTKALIKHIETPGQDIANLMRRVRLDVINATSSRQVPWNNSSLTAPFIFKAKPKEDGRARAELALWNAAKEGEGDAGYKNYLERHPDGRYATLARTRLEQLTYEATRRAERARQKKERAELARLKAELEAEQQRMARVAAERKKREEGERKSIEAERTRREIEDRALAEKTAILARVKVVNVSPDISAVPETEKAFDPIELTRALQVELKRVGCDPGRPDGIWGKNGRAALARFNYHAKLNLRTSQPTKAVLDEVQGRVGKICPALQQKRPNPKIKKIKSAKKVQPVKKRPSVSAKRKPPKQKHHDCGESSYNAAANLRNCW